MEIIIIAGLFWLMGAAWRGIRRAFSRSITTAQKQRLPSHENDFGQTSDSIPTSSEVPAVPGKTRTATTHSTDYTEASAADHPQSVSVVRADVIYHQVQPTGPSRIHGIRFLIGNKGNLVSSEDRDEWLRARRTGVSATDTRKIVLQNGQPSLQRPKLLLEKVTGDEGARFSHFEHGIEREPIIAAWVEENFRIRPNHLLCIGVNPRHMATPDGIGDGIICEIKTSTKPLASTAKTYRDQIQWQLHVTGVEKILFVVENRNSLEREHAWIERDEARIAVLTAHADHFLEELDAANAGAHFTGTAPVISENQSLSPAHKTLSEQRIIWPAATSSPIEAATHIQAPSLQVSRVITPQQSLKVAEPIPGWAINASNKILLDYDQGISLGQLVRDRSWATEDEVLQELSRCLLNVETPLNRKPSQRRKRTWTYDEINRAEDMYYTGVWLPGIAKELDCEQIDIAYALFTRRLPEVPQELIDNEG